MLAGLGKTLVEDGLPLVCRPQLHGVEFHLGVPALRTRLLHLKSTTRAGGPPGNGQAKRERGGTERERERGRDREREREREGQRDRERGKREREIGRQSRGGIGATDVGIIICGGSIVAQGGTELIHVGAYVNACRRPKSCRGLALRYAFST